MEAEESEIGIDLDKLMALNKNGDWHARSHLSLSV